MNEEECTHSNGIGFRVICLVVIPVNGILANNESGTDGKRETMTVGHSSKDLVNMVHCWDDSSKVGGATGKEQSCVLKYLAKVSISNRKNDRICDTYLQDIPKLLGNTPHSAGDSSYFWRSRSHFTVIL
jgi:hypothetical protein